MATEQSDKAKWLKARESDWPLGDGKKFVIRRPVWVEYFKWAQLGNDILLRNCIVGWRGFAHDDFEGGNDKDPVDFDLELACGWIGDRPEMFLELANHILELVNARQDALKGDRGNLPAPSPITS